MSIEELLIRSVRKQETLYNAKSAHYRDKSKRLEAWQKIGRELNIDPLKAKDLWDKLRRCFINAINRRRFRKVGQGPRRNMHWIYERQMAFLLPHMENRKIVKVQKYHTVTDQYGELLGQLQEDDDAEKDLDINESKLDDSVEQETKNTEYYIKEEPSGLDTLIEPEGETSRAMISPSQETCQNLEDYYTPPRSRRNELELDESDMFYLSMSRMAKGLSMIKQTQLKIDLSKAVLGAEMELRLEQSQSGSLEESGS